MKQNECETILIWGVNGYGRSSYMLKLQHKLMSEKNEKEK